MYNFSRSTTFILIISLFDKVMATLLTKSTSLPYSFMKLEETYIRFVNNVSTTMSNEQIVKIKVVDLQKLGNFVVEHFLPTNTTFEFL